MSVLGFPPLITADAAMASSWDQCRRLRSQLACQNDIPIGINVAWLHMSVSESSSLSVLVPAAYGYTFWRAVTRVPDAERGPLLKRGVLIASTIIKSAICPCTLRKLPSCTRSKRFCYERLISNEDAFQFVGSRTNKIAMLPDPKTFICNSVTYSIRRQTNCLCN